MPESEPESASLLLYGWRITSLWLYPVLVATGAFMLRLAISSLKGIDAYGESDSTFRQRFWVVFKGQKLDREDGDYWHSFVLGFLELAVYPILMVTGSWTFIGAWLVLKTAGQWRAWKERRCPFNRFLIGNALALIWSFLILSRLVVLR
jgi:hypothetical protein